MTHHFFGNLQQRDRTFSQRAVTFTNVFENFAASRFGSCGFPGNHDNGIRENEQKRDGPGRIRTGDLRRVRASIPLDHEAGNLLMSGRSPVGFPEPRRAPSYTLSEMELLFTKNEL